MKLMELLNSKDFKHRSVVTVTQDEHVLKAAQIMAEHDRGALPVCDNRGNVVGIITERDIVRKCFAPHHDLKQIKVKEIMTCNVVVATPEDEIDYAINVMQQKRIRHLPVIAEQKVIGMISMRDLLGVRLEEHKIEVRFLNDYISYNLW